MEELIAQIRAKKSLLCVGLDTDMSKIPPFLLTEPDPIFAFNKAIIDATAPYAVAYKPNVAFYEAQGLEGWQALKRTVDYLNVFYPQLFTIADAKRGDIGNTAAMYAKSFFTDLKFDSVTVAPYMGRDSVEPFLEYEDKNTILLALTSNEGAVDFQLQKTGEDALYKKVIRTSLTWKNSQNLMYVVGATKAEHLKEVRALIPEHFLLVPGVGAQGGSVDEVCENALNEHFGLLINSSRGIIYASHGEDFAAEAAIKAKELQEAMARWIY
ncbi:orotidine-5'-phosphate decarboxylase [Capnocytophaga haemolytica]